MKISSLALLLVILLFGCSSNTTTETLAVIWMGGPSQDNILFEIKSNKTIKLSQGNVSFDTDTKEIYYGETLHVKIVKPNSKEIQAINELLSNIGSKEERLINPVNDAVEVFSCINNKIYYTPFDNDSPSNKELWELTKLLHDITRDK